MTTQLDVTYERQRYSRKPILLAEMIYGGQHQSPGGIAGTRFCYKRIPLPRPTNVLDVGSGLGGASFFFHEGYGARVTGVDPSPAMIEISLRTRDVRGAGGAQFVLGDIFLPAFDNERFDLVWSRDVLMYEPRKVETMQRAWDLCSPNGHLVITDFCRGGHSPEFDRYVDVSGYDLITIDAYATAIRDAGFALTHVEDISHWSLDQLHGDLAKYKTMRDEVIRRFGEADYAFMVERWERKIAFAGEGLLVEGLFIGTKEAA
jgi:phosphoethanolamine N-methyltransferase